MSVTITLPTLLARHADGQRSLVAAGPTLGDAIAQITDQFPALAPRLVDALGEPYPYVSFYVNDEDARFTGGFAAPVSDGDEVTIVSAVAGG